MVHGCVIGNGATAQDGARIGMRALVAAGATVAPGAVVPPGQVVMGTGAKERGPATGSAQWWVANNPETYRELARRHRAGVRPVTDEEV